MKTQGLKIGMVIVILIAMCFSTSWADSRKYGHPHKHGYSGKQSKSNRGLHHRPKPHRYDHRKHNYHRHHLKEHRHHYRRHHHDRYHSRINISAVIYEPNWLFAIASQKKW